MTDFMIQRFDGKNNLDSNEVWVETLWISNYDGSEKGITKALAALELARQLHGTREKYRLIMIFPEA